MGPRCADKVVEAFSCKMESDRLWVRGVRPWCWLKKAAGNKEDNKLYQPETKMTGYDR
jgi:hypothetical protein